MYSNKVNQLIFISKEVLAILEKVRIMDRNFVYAKEEIKGIISIAEDDEKKGKELEIGLILGYLRIALSLLEHSEIDDSLVLTAKNIIYKTLEKEEAKEIQ